MTRIVRSFGLAFLALAIGGLAVARPADDDPFADSNAATVAPEAPAKAAAAADDPFADGNAASAPKLPSKAAPVDKTADLLTLEATIEPKEVHPGQVARLTIHGKPKAGYHTYPVTQYSEDPAQSPSSLTQLSFAASDVFRPLQPLAESEPEFVVDKAGGVFLEYTQPFTWSQDILVLPETPSGDRPVTVDVKFQVCDEVHCIPGERHLTVPLKVTGAAVALTPELLQRLKELAVAPKAVMVPDRLRARMSNAPAVATAPGEPSQPADATTPTRAGGAMQVPLVQQLGIAFFQGFIMLLTPCVFPMIPITISFFLKQGEREHHRPLALATVYSGTIFFMLTFAVLVLGKIIIDLANNPWLNLAMGALLLFFALSLFGMFEIELPHFVTRFTSAREGQGGYIGAFFMALTFTVNSFTCTGPFLGPLLSGIKELHLSIPELIANAVAYSAGFAGPFFVLALFPRLLKALPRSGGWLNSTKVVMGFVEIALAVKFLSITDASLNPGNPRFFNYDTVLCMWMALSLCCGLYLLGIFRLPHDSRVESIGVLRLMMATFFLGLAVYMAPLLSRKSPQGSVGDFLTAWLPQDSNPEFAAVQSAPGTAAASSELTWSSDYQQAWEQAKKDGKLVFIDFTGVNCQNCRYNEKNIFPRQEVRSELAKFVRVRLYTDLVPDRRLSPSQSHGEAERNFNWQKYTFHDNSLPLYVVLDPSGVSTPLTNDGTKFDGAVKGQASGAIMDVPAFVDVLKKAQEKQVARGE